MAIVALLVALLVPAIRPASAVSFNGCQSPVSVSAPATNLASVVAGQAPGTCFVLSNGTYRFHDVVPKDGMMFIGESTTGVVVDGRGHENAFHGTSDGVTIANMTFQDFNSSAGTKRQEQSPIRGTARLWASDRGQLATNWTIDSIISQRNYAAGIFLGDHFTVRNSVFRNNGVTGISGDSFVGGLVEFNTVYRNGANQASGVEVNGGGMKFGQAGTAQHPVVIRNNEVYDNPNIGIWCDIGCEGFHVIDNLVRDHVSRGIMYELSRNLVVRGNTVVRANTWTNYLGDFNAGAITVGESQNALVENNRIEVARAGVVVRQTRRPYSGEGFLANYPTVNYVTADVTVRNNVLVGVGSMGVSTGASGAGIIDDRNIRFTGNSYDNPGAMTFWWTRGQRMSFAQWRAAGRDTVSGGSSSTPSAGAGQTSPTAPPTTAPPTTAAPTTAAPTTAAPTTVPSTTAPSTTAISKSVEHTAGEAAATRPAQLPLRINSGGDATIDERGSAWIADRYYVGGNVAAHADGVDIRNTSDDALYRDERWGAVGYDIPVPEGRYRIRLHHAEVFFGCQSSDCREFSVEVEGEVVVSDVDLYDEVGGYSALIVETTQDVDDGVLSIRFSSSRQEPQISGIEVEPAPLGPTAAPAETAGDAAPVPTTTGGSTVAPTPEAPAEPSSTASTTSPTTTAHRAETAETSETGETSSPTTIGAGTSTTTTSIPEAPEVDDRDDPTATEEHTDADDTASPEQQNDGDEPEASDQESADRNDVSDREDGEAAAVIGTGSTEPGSSGPTGWIIAVASIAVAAGGAGLLLRPSGRRS